MYVFWGEAYTYKTCGTKSLKCTICDQSKDCHHRLINGWFNALFIPIYPYGAIAEYLECPECYNTYPIEYGVAGSPAPKSSELQRAVLRVILCCLASFGPTSTNKRIAAKMYREVGKNDLENDLMADMDESEEAEDPLYGFLKELSYSLNLIGKMKIAQISAELIYRCGGSRSTKGKSRLYFTVKSLSLPITLTHELMRNYWKR